MASLYMKDKKNIISIAIIIALCAVIAILLFVRFHQPEDSGDFLPQLDPNATAPRAEEDEEKNEPEGIRIPGYPSITIPANTETISVNLMNPEGNPCYFTFELVLTEGEESLYTSGMVEPGKAITEITLPHGLAAGEHPATIKITTNSLEDGSAMNGANVETVLIAQ